MSTSTELQLLRNADPGVQLPGIDTPAGNPLAAGSLKPLSSISTSTNAPFHYEAANNTVYVTQAGVTLSGYNFGSATVAVQANNVTIVDCDFTDTSGWYAVQSWVGDNITVTNCSFNFDADALPARLAAWIGTTGSATVTNNSFINTPADGIGVSGGGVISGNYFSGGGDSSTGQPPDAILVMNSTMPLLITDNLIDWTPTANLSGVSDIFITDAEGPVSNVTVTGNYLMGAASTLLDGAADGTGAYSNQTVRKRVDVDGRDD